MLGARKQQPVEVFRRSDDVPDVCCQVLNQLSMEPLMNEDSPDLDPSHPMRLTLRLGQDSSDKVPAEVGWSWMMVF